MSASPTLLSLVRSHLAQRYQQELGRTLADGGANAQASPSWRLVNADDLRTPITSETGSAAGALMDPELGLVLFVIPFVPATKLEPQVQAALSLQSKLQPQPTWERQHPAGEAAVESVGSEAGAAESNSPAGCRRSHEGWQVALHWLVETSAREAWEFQIAQLRQRSRFSEELALDAIYYAPNGLPTALAAHGLPRLWLAARQVFARATPGEIGAWLSADKAVVRELEGFAENFSDPEQRRRAQLIQDQLGELLLQPNENAKPAIPKPLDRLEILDFRNLRQVRLDFGLAPVSCRVVHGPNGTGKSSVFEALCLSLSGSSARYRDFLNRDERDLSGADRRRLYLQQYLTPMSDLTLQPRLGLNGQPPAPPSLVDSWEEAYRLDTEFSGNFLAQETSREFLHWSADQLAARVLAGYSGLAERLEAFVEQRVSQANQARQGFLRSLGLSSNITRIETALERIIGQALESELPPPPPALLDWLTQVTSHPGAAAAVGSLLNDWRLAGDPVARRNLAASLAKDTETELLAALEAHLKASNALIERTRKMITQLANHLAVFEGHGDEMHRDLTAWGQWLGGRSARPAAAVPPPGHLADLRRQLAEAQAAQQKIMKQGQAAKQHLEHLDQAVSFLAKSWAAGHPSQCPTCGADHAAHGGIENVVSDLRAAIGADRENLATEYRTLDEKIKTLQRALSERGETPCPLSAERQALLREALAWLQSAAQPPLEAQLKEPALRNQLVNLLQKLHAPPALPNPVDARAEARRLAQGLLGRLEDARNLFLDPDYWKPVQATFLKKLTQVVDRHLPETLQRLWMELALNLTAAPWLLPERPAFAVVNKRGEQRVTVRVQDRLARYLLNQAETHLLGLGWFFSRYLTHGRFLGRFLAMDDPAQQLDQTSFRELCRLWRVLVRLHAARQVPFRLLLFLHQEDRALDAARATGGRVELLGWQPEQKGELRAVELFAPGAAPASPSAWFDQPEPAAA